MRLLPAYFGSRKKRDDDTPPPLPEEPAVDSQRDIFNLIPPRANENAATYEPFPTYEPLRLQDPVVHLQEPVVQGPVLEEPPPPKPQGRNRHPVDMTDLSRLSIDTDGRLYWDGKAVEVHRRLLMSRGQVVGASLIAAVIVIGAAGAAMQGRSAAYDWGCKLGWFTSHCARSTPAPAAPPSAAPRIEIPA
jgi:hypothetical protein